MRKHVPPVFLECACSFLTLSPSRSLKILVRVELKDRPLGICFQLFAQVRKRREGMLLFNKGKTIVRPQKNHNRLFGEWREVGAGAWVGAARPPPWFTLSSLLRTIAGAARAAIWSLLLRSSHRQMGRGIGREGGSFLVCALSQEYSSSVFPLF